MNLSKRAPSCRHLLSLLVLATISQAQQGFYITSHSPQKSENHVHPATTIKLNFSQSVSLASLPSHPLTVMGDVLGNYAGTLSFENGNRTLCFRPKRAFCAGENVQITLNRKLMSVDGEWLGRPFSFSFNIASGLSSLRFHHLKSIPLNNLPYPIQLSPSDLNADGLPDFVVGTYTNLRGQQPAKLAILRSVINRIGDYTLEEKVSGISTCCFMLATFDDDVCADLIALDTGSLQFLKGWGNYFADYHELLAWQSPIWGDITDYDGDGDFDFAIAGKGAAIFDNDGDAKFQNVKVYDESLWIRFIAWGDINNDDLTDLLVSINLTNSSKLTAYLSDGLGNFNNTLQNALKDYTTFFQLRDFDNDSDLDVVAIQPLYPPQNHPHVGIIEVLTNNGEGKLSSHQMLLPQGMFPALLDCRDLDGDGDIDIACTNSGPDPGPDSQPDSTVAFFLNDGAGRFNWLMNLKVGRLPKGLRFVDINQDSRLDLAVVTVDPPALHLFLADTLTSDIDDEPIPTTHRLSLKINPNPFRDAVTIHLQAPINVAGELFIFDVLGRKVFSAPVQIRSEKETILWNGRDSSNRLVPSGIYLAKLKVGAESASKKLVLLR